MVTKIIDQKIANSYSDDLKKMLNDVLVINGFNKTREQINTLFDDMLKFIEDGSAYIIGAFDDKKIAGFIWVYKRNVDEKIKLHINYFIVNEEYRRLGIGKKLIDEVLAYAKKNNIHNIELMVSSSNASAISFYQNNGFTEERVMLCKEI